MSDIDLDKLKGALREDLRQRWKKTLSDKESKPAVKRRISPLSWAAAVLLLLAAGGWYFWTNAGPDAAALFAEHFEPLPNALSPGIRGNSDMMGLDRALLLYEGGNYDDALVQFGQIPESDLPAGAFLYRGICYIGTQQWDEAMADLDRAESSIYRLSVGWYKAMASLGANDLESARTQLEEIAAQEGNPFRDRAVTLLEAW